MLFDTASMHCRPVRLYHDFVRGYIPLVQKTCLVMSRDLITLIASYRTALDAAAAHVNWSELYTVSLLNVLSCGRFSLAFVGNKMLVI